eukprot:CAMPEP_0174717898 /NCGR_PEP_ID=MMETSP1094-20130205/27485_1 /TAXON_ID=156173 /ORGANISM="Chrysochromulina brevifilum, Strain UTEX LB 985" /LENGTH=128 /DNA_ID=CAMNT_0015917901 /DNA_START=253 /DNA_END=639 /DNA_ORIENTATION=-
MAETERDSTPPSPMFSSSSEGGRKLEPERTAHGGRMFANVFSPRQRSPHMPEEATIEARMLNFERAVHGGKVFQPFAQIQSANCMPDLEKAVHGGKIFTHCFLGEERFCDVYNGAQQLRPGGLNPGVC